MAMKGWTAGLVALAATVTAEATSRIGLLVDGMALDEESSGSALALVGVGLMVLSVFARRRDP